MKTVTPGSQKHHKMNSAMAEICSLRVGEILFGIPISHILEILGSAQPQPVPLAAGFIGGLVHYRGDVLTTVSLRYLLHLPAFAGPQAVLILDSPEGYFGLLVDSVGEVLTIPEVDLEPNPPNLDANRKAFFLGAYKLTNGLLLVMLDADQPRPSSVDCGVDGIVERDICAHSDCRRFSGLSVAFCAAFLKSSGIGIREEAADGQAGLDQLNTGQTSRPRTRGLEHAGDGRS